eukprot:CAMPEP_0172712842 /NCGR_PEP_ID=MMETSP1074-20121228/61338_1 /TAXON_ID=2916 /ORGANISM="Ceratium fusus, Strain PA161109" /LENGTH=204 /DNA_ID=CAMNT_0013536831 /DNA_START=118 /DNA_END=730 /DNA_ORIENTATION=+
MPTTALDLTQGITEYSSRMALKMLFGQFGEVTACWIPPLEHRGSERAYVKFNTTKSAQAALDAANAGHLYLDGVCLRAEWRLAPARTQDSRDFEARGSNLMTSRDLMRAEAKKAREERGKFRRGKEHNDTADEKEENPETVTGVVTPHGRGVVVAVTEDDVTAATRGALATADVLAVGVAGSQKNLRGLWRINGAAMWRRSLAR